MAKKAASSKKSASKSMPAFLMGGKDKKAVKGKPSTKKPKMDKDDACD